MTRGELRRQRKADRAAGRPWAIETGEAGGLEIVRSRTRGEERRHRDAMDRWARSYDALDGAPESDGDR